MIIKFRYKYCNDHFPTIHCVRAYDELQSCNALFQLKAKASRGIPWSAEENAFIEACLNKKNEISILAACCVLSSQRPKGHVKSLGIVREAIKGDNLPHYVEMSVYEALIYVEPQEVESFCNSLFHFIEQSIANRTVNLDNTVVLLGNLARNGKKHALLLLRSLEHDDDVGLRANAAIVLRGIEEK